MNSDSDSEGEGFYKPKIQISDTKPIYTEEIIRVE